MADRAVLFVDGNNWYHGLREVGVAAPGRLDYRRIAEKLVGPAREWIGTRYYIGQVTQDYSAELRASQQRFLDEFRQADGRHQVFYGRLEVHPRRNEAAEELMAYLGALKVRIDPTVRSELFAIARAHRSIQVATEKAVDVMLAVDLVTMAQRNEFDTAYILSADGDFTPAAQFAKTLGKKVFACSTTYGGQLGKVVHSYIHIRNSSWFDDCFKA